MDSGEPPIAYFVKISAALPHYGIEDIAGWPPDKINAVYKEVSRLEYKNHTHELMLRGVNPEEIPAFDDVINRTEDEKVLSVDQLRLLGCTITGAKN